MPEVLGILGGRVIDPADSPAEQRRDLWSLDGRLVSEAIALAALKPGQSPVRLDASGGVVMAGAIDMHAHVAAAGAQAARRLQSDAGLDPLVPDVVRTGLDYLAMGYTTVMEAAVAPRGAELAHCQLDELPGLDAGLLVLLGNLSPLIEALERGDGSHARAIAHAELQRARAWGIKSVNAGAVEAWRRDPSRTKVHSLDNALPGGRVSSRGLLDFLTGLADDFGLLHPLHVHGPHLGAAGGIDITLDAVRGLSGRRLHLAHLQYYAYGRDQTGRHVSAVDQLVEGLSTQRSMTADLGLVAFGPAFTATADLPLEYELWGRLGGPSRPCVMLDPGNEDALGVMPYRHDPGQAMSALQWATGLELALKWPDLERLSLTVDHPNGGSFLNYPQLIALLMSKPRRDEALAGCHGWARERTGLASISRELTLTEVAAITRLAPARALGLAMKGRLTVGVDADVVVYEDRASDPRAMFSEPRHVVKAGVRVAGRLASPTAGPTAGVASIAARGRRFAASL